MKRFLLACSLGLCAVLLSACGKPAPNFNSTDVSGADWGRDFHLHDAAGQSRALADFKGKVVVLFFGYTQCPDVCPTTLSTAAAAMRLLGSDADKVQVIFVTLDPARDTPQVMAKYAPAFDPHFIGLLGNEEETAAVAKTFKVFYQKRPGATPDSYTLDHTAASYAFDPQGRLRLYMKYGETPEQLAADIKLLLAGE
ncbi:MAG TPA: SCO family protein [Rhodocyclaceae bacterium]|nr:SCO family protein [Rhodocyclaceae bacterium]